MSVYQSVEGGWEIDTTPVSMPGGRYAAQAVVRRAGFPEKSRTLMPDYEPFGTEAEAASAAHMAALAWIAHPTDLR